MDINSTKFFLGIADVGDDEIPYTSMLYTTGQGYNYYVNEDGDPTRPDPSEEDTLDFEYKQLSAVKKDKESHGGEDVPIYAKGPWAHLFYKTHEQSFITNVMAYASCVGPYVYHCRAT